MAPVRRELLEVPYVSALERRLAVTPAEDFTKLQRPNITPVVQSSMLDRIRGFLPQMAAANVKLEQDLQVRPASDFDIESLPEAGQGTYVEMDLSCGLFELRDSASVRAAELAVARGADADPADGAASSGSSSSDEDSDSDDDRGAAAAPAAALTAAVKPAAPAATAKGGRSAGGGCEMAAKVPPRQPRRVVAARRHGKIMELN